MQLYFGSYAFPVNAAAVTSRTGYVRTKNGRPVRRTVSLDVVARLFGTGQAALTKAEADCRTALEKPYQDLVLRQDGGTPSALKLITNDSLSGVVVTSGPDFTEAMSPDYVSVRTVRFTAEAEYIIRGTEDALFEYTESLSISGNGGPVERWRVPINTPDMIRQQVSPRSVVRYVQAGTAVGHTRYPQPPPYLLPVRYLMNEQVSFVTDFPEPRGRGWVNFPIKWSYVFEADRLVSAAPRLPRF